jgi:hypothetical protein
MAVVSIVISFIALIVSVFVVWKNYLSAFRLSVWCGNPRLEPGEYKLEHGKGKAVIRFGVVLPLYFINSGAHDGIIEDIALIVQSAQNTWLFQPAFYCRYSMSTESTLGERLTEDQANEPFYPLYLQGKETLYRPVVFMPVSDNRKFPLGDNPLLPGKYTFQLNTLEAGKKDYEVKHTFRITLSEEKTGEFASKASPAYLIPFMDEVLDKRQML